MDFSNLPGECANIKCSKLEQIFHSKNNVGRRAMLTRVSPISIPSSTQEHNVHPSYRADIDGLRALAILSVLCYHAFPSAVRGGFVGVDVFFVISGFLISSIIFRSLQRGDFNFLEFYAHRARRIFPTLILALGVSYSLGWVALLPGEFKQLGKHMAASAGFIQNFVLWKEAGYFDTATELKPLMHLWSLSIEEQFYLLYPLLVWAAWRLGLNVFTAIVVLGLLSFGLNVFGVEKDIVRTFFSLKTRFWELLAGGWLAYLQAFKQPQLAAWLQRVVFHPVVFRQLPSVERRGPILNGLLSGIGFFLILAAVFGLKKGQLFPGWWAAVPVLGAFLLILAGPDGWVNRRLLANPVMVFIGLISYPLYVWHWPLLSFARIVESGVPSATIRVAAVAISLVAAWLTYRLVERPIRFGRKHWSKTAGLCLALATVGFVGFNAYTRDGLDFRQKTLRPQLQQFKWDETSLRGQDKCSSMLPVRLHPKANCVGDSSAPIMVLGDSHANSLQPGLVAYHLHAQAVDGPFCLPFANVQSTVTGSENYCPEIMNPLLDYVVNNKSITTVILAFRGAYYLGDMNTANSGMGGASYIANPFLPHADAKQIFQVGLSETLERLTKAGKRVVVVQDYAELSFDPTKCIARPFRLTAAAVTGVCAVSREDFEKRNRGYRDLVTAVVQNFHGVQIFDAASQFCDAQYCWAMKDGQMFYRDDNHLSVAGSTHVASGFVKLIQLSTR